MMSSSLMRSSFGLRVRVGSLRGLSALGNSRCLSLPPPLHPQLLQLQKQQQQQQQPPARFLLSRLSCVPPSRLLLPSRPFASASRVLASSSSSKDPSPSSASSSSSSSSPTPQGTASSTSEHESETLTQKVRRVVKMYGWVGVGVYATVYATTISTLFTLLYAGVDVPSLATKIGLDRWVEIPHNPATSITSTLLLAFLLTKLTSPVRIVLVLSITPTIARLFGRRVVSSAASAASPVKHPPASSSTSSTSSSDASAAKWKKVNEPERH